MCALNNIFLFKNEIIDYKQNDSRAHTDIGIHLEKFTYTLAIVHTFVVYTCILLVAAKQLAVFIMIFCSTSSSSLLLLVLLIFFGMLLKSLVIVTISWIRSLALSSTYHPCFFRSVYTVTLMICERFSANVWVFTVALFESNTQTLAYTHAPSRRHSHAHRDGIVVSFARFWSFIAFSVTAAYYPLMLFIAECGFSFIRWLLAAAAAFVVAVFCPCLIHSSSSQLWQNAWNRNIYTQRTAFPINNLASLYSVPSWISFWTVRYTLFFLTYVKLLLLVIFL